MGNKTTMEASKGIRGEITIVPDKSISHRSVILGALAEGKTEIDNYLMAQDCLSTIDCFRKMEVPIHVDASKGRVHITGVGKRGLKEPGEILDAGNSGTTMRLLLGVLAGQEMHSILTGDKSLSNRPMKRVAEPLRMMGATIEGRDQGNKAPISIRGRQLQPISCKTPVASAQIKSAIMLAALNAQGTTEITEPSPSRNHSELMFDFFGAKVDTCGTKISVSGASTLKGSKLTVPGDISSAAFFMVAASIVPNSELIIKNVGVNKTRSGIIQVLREMGGSVELYNQREEGNEPVADILVKSARLKGVEISGSLIPRLIDEIPIIAVAAAVAEGETVIRDAAELRVKETDRLAALAENLTRLGITVEILADGLIIDGQEGFNLTAHLESYDDHRIAMAMAVAGLKNSKPTVINNVDCINISFSDFFEQLASVNP
ncbi:3-phosphoshikimate 1-carboxyvinyltransferase [Desulfitispora alkaliphila]|uniref:3-phosphoshikimate 1-carboxyvinyltransferase n=1 Tax=Desulfitispora alkaliphila TaxID=622674 RepID=UPI003D196411